MYTSQKSSSIRSTADVKSRCQKACEQYDEKIKNETSKLDGTHRSLNTNFIPETDMRKTNLYSRGTIASTSLNNEQKAKEHKKEGDGSNNGTFYWKSRKERAPRAKPLLSNSHFHEFPERLAFDSTQKAIVR
ncbi:hypothetical protein WH47_11051 [Habropoda laboriosa]|uniref:Uncharacterized protein n=1 Tax=Habropoda laboriosa TaxID=597456 RepID=A0A0L7QLB6_9HYME|nr:hypothetical protein WH47_11051 [Habropoda laboriosa]